MQPRSVRDKFTGEWRRTTTLSREFAALVRDRLLPSETAPVATPPTATPSIGSEKLLESERRFDAELERIGGEAARSGEGTSEATAS
ncbi:MAG TPA: hypothetical protein VIW73_08650 [Candidatus Cybelea sp.]